MSGPSKIRVLVVEDHPLTADGVRALLEAAGGIVIVAHAVSGAEALVQAQSTKPDVVIVDLNLPDMSGLKVIEALAADHPHVRAVVLTMHEEEEYIPRALRAGARGYVLKSANSADLITAVRNVHDGQCHFPGEMAVAILRDYQADTAVKPRLTKREAEVLRLIAQGRLNKEIAEALFISVRTVETYRGRLMKKLELHSVADLTRYAIKDGMLEA